MCFSATASLVAGGVLGAAGVITLAKAKKKAELPFASVPLLFGIQQIIEGVVWLSFGHSAINTAAIYAYTMFSHLLWPILIPLAVLLVENEPIRKRVLRVFSVFGLGIGLYFLYFIIKDGVTARIVSNGISYDSLNLYNVPVIFLYLLATCGSSLVSSHRIIKIFGVVMLILFMIAAWFFATIFISVWCSFAAILSLIVYWYFRKKYPRVSHHKRKF